MSTCLWRSCTCRHHSLSDICLLVVVVDVVVVVAVHAGIIH